MVLSGKRAGDTLHDAWNELPRNVYHMIIQRALARCPYEMNNRHVITNLLEVNREAVRVYREYKKGKFETFGGRLVEKRGTDTNAA